jgi:hypothetical protein
MFVGVLPYLFDWVKAKAMPKTIFGVFTGKIMKLRRVIGWVKW